VFFEGQQVSFVGHPSEDGPDIGDEGLVVAAGNTASHIKFLTGARTGCFHEISHSSLVLKDRAREGSLDGRLVNVPIRHIAASDGTQGLIDALDDAGHLGNFESMADEALRYTASLVRNDPSISEVIAQLDSDEAEDFVASATLTLLREAFGRDDG
jgi:hypothetical protein